MGASTRARACGREQQREEGERPQLQRGAGGEAQGADDPPLALPGGDGDGDERRGPEISAEIKQIDDGNDDQRVTRGRADAPAPAQRRDDDRVGEHAEEHQARRRTTRGCRRPCAERSERQRPCRAGIRRENRDTAGRHASRFRSSARSRRSARCCARRTRRRSAAWIASAHQRSQWTGRRGICRNHTHPFAPWHNPNATHGRAPQTPPGRLRPSLRRSSSF